MTRRRTGVTALARLAWIAEPSTLPYCLLRTAYSALPTPSPGSDSMGESREGYTGSEVRTGVGSEHDDDDVGA